MSIKDYNKLIKLVIEPENGGKSFEVMVNPESFSEKFSAVYQNMDTANSGIEGYTYLKSLPQDFSFKILIDVTGVFGGKTPYLPNLNEGTTVYEKVNEFLGLAWFPANGKPAPLKIKWGEFSCSCVLKDVTINYTLFNREGLPLRAELDAHFIGATENNAQYYEKRFKPALGINSSSKKVGNGITITIS